MSLVVVFGIPGVGKSYVGRIIESDFGYYCYDADEDLTEEMIASIKQEQVFTASMRQHYFDLVIAKTKELLKKYPNVVITQALIKEQNRHQLLAELPTAKFIHVTADDAVINQRLQTRNNWISIAFANKIRAIFEEPRIAHFKIDNNSDKQHVKDQLEFVESLL